MATSGSFDTGHRISGSYNTYATFSWWQNSQSVANNKTNIGFNFVGKTASSGQWVYTYNANITVDGQWYGSWEGKMYNNTEMISNTKDVSHNADGSKTLDASGSLAMVESNTTKSGSGSWSLNTIPRQATATSASNFNDEGNPTLGYENKAGNSVNSLQACIADTSNNVLVSYRNINKTKSSYTFDLTTSERTTLRNACSTNSMKVRLFVKTVIGNNTYYDYKECTMSIVNANPTFSNFTYQDTNSTITAITGNNQYIVQNKSTLRAIISSANKAVAKKGATMSSYTFAISSYSGSANYSSSNINKDIGTINASTNQTLTITAKDSRGNPTAVSKTVNIVPYSSPTITPTVSRANNFEATTTIAVSGKMSLLQVNGTTKNAVNSTNGVQYRYKVSSSSSWGSWTNIASSTASNGNVSTSSFTLTFDNTKSYNFEFKITDKLETKTVAITLPQGQPQFFVGSDGRVAVGGTPSYVKGPGDTGLLDVKGQIYGSSDIWTGRDLIATRDLKTRYGWDYQINSRLHNGGATAIPANANLNSKAYCQIGTYLCAGSSTGATISNNPCGSAFTMEVRALLASGTLNLNGTWQYIERVLRCGTDNTIYRQYCEIAGTAGSIRYGSWNKYDYHDNRAQGGVWSSFYYAGTNANDQDITVYTKKGTALTLRMENGGGILLVKGGAGNIKFARQTWSTKYTAMNQNYGVKGLSSGSTVYTRYIGAVVNNDVPGCGEWSERVDGGDTSNGYYGNLASTLGGNRNATTCSMTMTRVGGSGTAWALQGTISSNGIKCAMSFDAQVTALNNNFIPTTYQRGENKSNTSAYSQLLEVFEG